MTGSKTMKMISLCVMLAIIAAAAATMIAGCDPTGTSQIVDQGKQLEQKAYDAARQANLKIIDASIQAYYAEHEEWPTSISQLESYFGGKVPTDAAGGTYYIVTENGEAKAAVK
jgi:competence protein ComGC